MFNKILKVVCLSDIIISLIISLFFLIVNIYSSLFWRKFYLDIGGILGIFCTLQTLSQIFWLFIITLNKQLRPIFKVRLRSFYLLLSFLLVVTTVLILSATNIYGVAVLFMPSLVWELWSLVYIYLQIQENKSLNLFFNKLFHFNLPSINVKSLLVIFACCFIVGLPIAHLVYGDSWVPFK